MQTKILTHTHTHKNFLVNNVFFKFLSMLRTKYHRLLSIFSLCNLCDRMTASLCDICACILASVAVDERGIIPRAIQELFQHISEHHNINFRVKVSYIEVYKEELRDLLDLETSVKELHIREDEKGNTGRISALKFGILGFRLCRNYSCFLLKVLTRYQRIKGKKS